MTFARYQHGSDDPQLTTDQAPQETGPQVRVRGEAYSVSLQGSEVVETTMTQDRGHTGELNPHHGDGSILATARNPNGMPVYEIEPTTLVECNGVQASVQFWVKEGVLQKNADGTYAEATSRPPEAAPADTSDYLPIGDAQMGVINAALEEVDQGSLDGLAAVGVGVAIGRLDVAALAQKFSQLSGHGSEDSQARVATIIAPYQAQADSALAAFGVAAGDLPALYAWARTNQQGQLQEAIGKQLHRHDVSGYRAIAEAWKSATPPSIAALKAAGLHARDQDGRQEVFVRGQWMSTKAAARTGLL